jgi:pimeloyl-ACP methyl ester carboxylesterase
MTKPTRFLLVPGFWLGAWAWDRVTPRLLARGFEVEAITLPGLDGTPPDAVGLQTQIDAVIETLGDQPAILVGHSGAGAIVHGVVDRVPDLVCRVIYVDSGPLPDGIAVAPDLPLEVTRIPLPSWEELEAEGSSIVGLSDEDLAEFRRRAVDHPAGPAREALRLHNPRRRSVPTTVITSTMSAGQVRELAAEGHPFFAELQHLRFDLVELPTGHWPMWSRPDDLAAQLALAAAGEVRPSD